MADLAQLQTWLSEAESARHQLAMGQQVVEVWREGRRLVYSKGSLSQLDSYIATLRGDIAQAESVAAGRPRRSAIGVLL